MPAPTKIDNRAKDFGKDLPCFCPFMDGNPCNTRCALIVAHSHENHYTQQYDYDYSCGLNAGKGQLRTYMEARGR